MFNTKSSKEAEVQRTSDPAFEIAYENYNNFKILHDRLVHHAPDFLDKLKLFTQTTSVVGTDLFEFFITGGRNPLKNVAQTMKAAEDQILIGDVERLVGQTKQTLLQKLEEMAVLITRFDERIHFRSQALEEMDRFLAKLAKKSKKKSSDPDEEFGGRRHQELVNNYAQLNDPLKRDMINLWADRAQFFNPLVTDFAAIQTGIGKLFLKAAQLNTAIGTPGATDADLRGMLQQFGLGSVITPTTGVLEMGAKHSDQQWDILSNLLSNPQQPGPVLFATPADSQRGLPLHEQRLGAVPLHDQGLGAAPLHQGLGVVPPQDQGLSSRPVLHEKEARPLYDEARPVPLHEQVRGVNPPLLETPAPALIPSNIAFEREDTIPRKGRDDLILPLQRDLVIGGNVAYDRPATEEHRLGEQRITGDGEAALPMTGEQRNFGVHHATVPLSDDTAQPLTYPHGLASRTGVAPAHETYDDKHAKRDKHDKHAKRDKHDKHDKHDTYLASNLPMTGDIQRDFPLGSQSAPIIDEARRELGQTQNIIPTMGQQNIIPTMGQQNIIPTMGQQNIIPTMGQQNFIPTGQTMPIGGSDFGLTGPKRDFATGHNATPLAAEIHREYGVGRHEEVGEPKRLFGLAEDVDRKTFTSKVVKEGESTKETYSR